jgi:hypothetical protein
MLISFLIWSKLSISFSSLSWWDSFILEFLSFSLLSFISILELFFSLTISRESENHHKILVRNPFLISFFCIFGNSLERLRIIPAPMPSACIFLCSEQSYYLLIYRLNTLSHLGFWGFGVLGFWCIRGRIDWGGVSG